MVDVVVVGAGVAGLTAARALRKAGAEVIVLEKSRGVGGRSATRRVHGNRVDHGAQYFTVRDERLQAEVETWLESGVLKVWSHGFHSFGGTLHAPDEGHPRYVFPAGMNTFGKLLAAGTAIRRETRVTALLPEKDHWRLEAGTETFTARAVVLNLPPEQALELCAFELEDEVRAALSAVAMQPCFALMAGFPLDAQPVWQGVRLELADNPLAWVAHDSSKRLNPKNTVLIAHSTPEFARENLERPLKETGTRMLAALAKFDERFSAPLWTDLQRWRYAMATRFLDKRCLQQDSLVFCGDWCGGNKLEAAYLSGLAAARALLDSLSSNLDT